MDSRHTSMPDLQSLRKRLDVRQRLIRLRDWCVSFAPAIILTAIVFGIALFYIQPAPPHSITMTTGANEGGYQEFGQRYRDILARDGIKVNLRPSAGAVENLERLKEDPNVDVGFVQGGIANVQGSENLFSLGSIYYEPLWVFTRKEAKIAKLTALASKRVAIGPEGSGTRILALELLALNSLSPLDLKLSDEGGQSAAEALIRGHLDAMFLVAAPEANTVQQLLRTPGIVLHNFDQAEAYTRRYPFLSAVSLPHGVIDFARNLPSHDINLLAPTANLVVKANLHPAIAYLLLQAAKEIHGAAGLLQRPGEFPNTKHLDLALAPEAARFYEKGPPLLQRYLPFWLATLFDRILILILPALAVLLPLARIAPSLYAWRVGSRIYRWYGELKYLEHDLRAKGHLSADDIAAFTARLRHIEEHVNDIPTPLAFSDRLYTLRQHIELVRSQILRNVESEAEAKQSSRQAAQ